jgi:predicted transcriptional regulator
MSTSDKSSLPSPPFYNVPNINNLRDAALYPLQAPNGSIRPGILFRSADVSKLGYAGWQAVHSIGVAHVFDLRSKPEVEKDVEGVNGAGGKEVKPEWIEAMEKAGVERTWVPVFKEADYSPEKLAERFVKYMDEDVQGFVAAYRGILSDAGDAYRTIFLYLSNLQPAQEGKEQEKLGALVHCTAGKDRTGLFFGILFDFLGVPRQKIAEEYNLTEQGLQNIRDEVAARLMQSPAFKNYMAQQTTGKSLTPEEIGKLIANAGTNSAEEQLPKDVQEKGRKAALRMIGARKESMLKSLEMLDAEFGGAEQYMREKCGLGDKELEALRRNLIIKEGR